MTTKARLYAIIAVAVVAVLAVAGVVTLNITNASSNVARDNGTRGVASGGKSPIATKAPTPTPSASAPAGGNAAGVGPADVNDPSLGITVVTTPDASNHDVGDGSATVPDNPAGDKAALDFVNAWISADYSTPDYSKSAFWNSKIAAISALTPSGSPYRSHFSKLATACQGNPGFSYKVGQLTAVSAHPTAIAADGNYVYSVGGTANARYGATGHEASHVFEGSLWTVEIPAPGQSQLVQSVTENIPGYNLDAC